MKENVAACTCKYDSQIIFVPQVATVHNITKLNFYIIFVHNTKHTEGLTHIWCGKSINAAVLSLKLLETQYP